MNIERFAAAAQKAARHLSSLDEMAEKDEYIQSPDLNVRKKKNGLGHESSSSSFSDANSSSEFPAVVEDFSNRIVDAISMAARPSPSRSASSALVSSKAPSARTQSPTTEITTKESEKHTTKPALMSSVAAVYEQSNVKNSILQTKQKSQPQQLSNKQISKDSNATSLNEKHALILQQLDYDSDSDSSDSYQSRDSHSHALHEELEYEVNNCSDANQEKSGILFEKKDPNRFMTMTADSINQETSDVVEKKDPNRFMTMASELESEREALIVSNTSNNLTTLTTTTTTFQDHDDGRSGLWGGNNALRGGTAGEETNKAIKKGLSWLQKVASPQLNAISQLISSRIDNSQSKSGNGPMIPSRLKTQHNESDEENITMTTSSTFLSADEIAEFEQMKSKTSQSSILGVVLPLVEALKSNQRMAFIAITLLLSMFVYYYSRKRSVDDVL